MASDIESLRIKRPEKVQRIECVYDPKPYEHKPHEDKLAILVCQIKIWKATGRDWFTIPSVDTCLTIRECESIEINNSAKELINKAIIRFPRGTVINRSSFKDKIVKSGKKEDKSERSDKLKDSSNKGDVITAETATFKNDGVSVTSMAANYDDKGLVEFNRTKTEPALLSPNDVAVGNRIEIRLGYAYSEPEFKKLNKADNGAGSVLEVAFTGFITSISVNTPLEIECTNMAHVLNTIGTKNINDKSTLMVKDFLDPKSKYDLLKDTGISLAKHCEGCEISVPGGSMTNNLTVADILTSWEKTTGVLCVLDTLDNGSVELRVGLLYYAGRSGGRLPNSDKRYITYNGGDNTVTLLQSDWDISRDSLKFKQYDKKYLAVEAQGRLSNNSYYKFTIRKNPDLDDEGWMHNIDGDWQIINRRRVTSKRELKFNNGTFDKQNTGGHLTDFVNLDRYNVVTYLSSKKGISEKELYEEAKRYWADFNPNGISGSIEIFGDINVKPAEVVGIMDLMHPEKNGYFFVESVKTTFGINGFRRELTIPHKVSSLATKIKKI